MTLWKRLLFVLSGWVSGVEVAPTPVADPEAATPPADSGSPAPAEPSSSSDPAAPWYALPEATLLEPEPMACPEMSHETRSIMGDLECTLENQDVELPPIPRVPEAVLRCLTSDDCDFREIAELISEDPSTTTRVLRMANAAIWGVKVTTSIPDAVVRLGARPLQSLMMSESLMVASRPSKKANRLIANRFWSRSLAAACITRSLAPLVKIDPEEAFVMGLLQDVGDVVVLRAVDRHEAFTHAPIETDAFEYLCFRFHESLGALVADKWSLTPKLKSLLSCHHAWPELNSPNRAERLLLMLSNMITQMLGYAQPATYNLPKSRPAQDLGLADQESFVNLLVRLPDQVRERVEACD